MKAISLFSGMGGDTLGLENAGINVIAFNDFNKKSVDTHICNFKNSKPIHPNISDISKIPDESFLEYQGEINLIFAGFPCQGFSHGGKKLPDDPRNTLFKEFVRSAELIQPEFIIGENVEGLLSRKTSTGENYIDVIKMSFEEIGYDVNFKVIHAVDCGVSQLRKRLIIVGVHKSLDYIYNFPEINIKPKYINIEPTLKNAVKIPWGKLPSDMNVTHIENFDLSGEVHPYVLSILAKEPEYNGKVFDSLLSYAKRESPIHLEIIDYKRPSKTIICTYDHQPRLLVPLCYKNELYIRPFTVNELKQIQGFPKEYMICGNIKDQIIQIGNAVPPPLVEVIVKPLVTFLES